MTVHQNYKSSPARPLWQWIIFFGVGIIVGVLIGRFMLSPNQETPSKQAAQNQKRSSDGGGSGTSHIDNNQKSPVS